MESNKKILIVEDEVSLRTPLSKTLTDEGFQVFQAENGDEGLKMAFQEHPDLILLDVFMPKMGGLEMLDLLRKDEWGKGALIMLLTNSTNTENVAEALEGNVTDYLVKAEWDLKEIVKKVKQKLSIGV
ncbi:response regulator [bacterium]|nr:response regulator [bacterium]